MYICVVKVSVCVHMCSKLRHVLVVIQIPHDELIEILQSVAVQRVSIGWEFKLPTDESFIQRYSVIQ